MLEFADRSLLRWAFVGDAVVLVALLVLFLTLLLPWAASAQARDALPSIAPYTEGMDAQDGYFPIYWDYSTGRLLLEIPRFDESFLYMISQVTGIGSNPLLLDRGTVGPTYVAHFERVGPKVLLVYENTSFRAETDATEALVRSVEESFPTSVARGCHVLLSPRRAGDRAASRPGWAGQLPG